MSKTFLISDLHFGHSNIIKYENRPFKDREEMDEFLIKKWNKVVKKYDKIYVLGDFSFYNKGKTKEIIKKLNGYKILIMGNHDREKNVSWWIDAGFNEVSRYPIIIDNYIILSHEPPEYISENSPYYYIYGHVHGTESYKTQTPKSACVCVERWRYSPVDMNFLFNKELING